MAICVSPLCWWNLPQSIFVVRKSVISDTDAAKRGTLVVTTPPSVLINGSPERLSPGARIKGLNNMLVMSGALVGNSVLVNYRRDSLGLIQEVWILTAEEALEKRDGMGTVTNIVFESIAKEQPKYPGQ